MADALYDRIGIDYARERRPDPRIAATIDAALGGAGSVVNVGAGTGSYEPAGRRVVAVDPSVRMIAQREPGSAPAVRAVAEHLPFRDGSFDAALAVLTIHHWRDRRRGLREMRRVARDRVVVFTWECGAAGFWLHEYFPDLVVRDAAACPTLEELAEELGPLEVRPVPVPHDCVDGFLAAYWRRPRAYLDRRVRAAMSSLAPLRDDNPALRRLARELDDGTWERRFGCVLALDSLDAGYRLVTAVAPHPNQGP